MWLFRERLIKSGKLEAVWGEFLNQLRAKGYVVKKGVIQDATFITSDPGYARSDVPRGKEAKTRRSRDGEWAIKTDTENNFIWEVETTVANIHDSKIDFGE